MKGIYFILAMLFLAGIFFFQFFFISSADDEIIFLIDERIQSVSCELPYSISSNFTDGDGITRYHCKRIGNSEQGGTIITSSFLRSGVFDCGDLGQEAFRGSFNDIYGQQQMLCVNVSSIFSEEASHYLSSFTHLDCGVLGMTYQNFFVNSESREIRHCVKGGALNRKLIIFPMMIFCNMQMEQ